MYIIIICILVQWIKKLHRILHKTFEHYLQFVFELFWVKKLASPIGNWKLHFKKRLNKETGFTNRKLHYIKLLNTIYNLSSNSEEYGVLFLEEDDSIIPRTCRNVWLVEAGVIFSRISRSRSSRGITSKLNSNFLAIFSASWPNFSASSFTPAK